MANHEWTGEDDVRHRARLLRAHCHEARIPTSTILEKVRGEGSRWRWSEGDARPRDVEDEAPRLETDCPFAHSAGVRCSDEDDCSICRRETA